MPSNATSTKGWKILGIAEIVIFIGLNILAYLWKGWPPIWLQLVAGASILATTIICFKVSEGAGGKPDTSDDWKMWAAVAAMIITLIIYLGYISQHPK